MLWQRQERKRWLRLEPLVQKGEKKKGGSVVRKFCQRVTGMDPARASEFMSQFGERVF